MLNIWMFSGKAEQHLTQAHGNMRRSRHRLLSKMLIWFMRLILILSYPYVAHSILLHQPLLFKATWQWQKLISPSHLPSWRLYKWCWIIVSRLGHIALYQRWTLTLLVTVIIDCIQLNYIYSYCSQMIENDISFFEVSLVWIRRHSISMMKAAAIINQRAQNFEQTQYYYFCESS